MQSSIHLNSIQKHTARRKGRHVMKEYKTLKQAFGNATARTIRDAKKEMEQAKSPSDPVIYWMVHPDVPTSEDRCGF